MKQQLIIFIRNPILTKVKTRIASTEGDEIALAIYQDLLEKCSEETIKVQAIRNLYYSDALDKEDNWDNEYFKKYLQKQGVDLGEKMHDAFKHLMQEVPIKTLIIGSDCYDLTAEIIHQAYKMLDQTDLVFGPANDGGYYLLGMKYFHPQLFQEISWSSSLVLEQSLIAAKEEGLSYSLLEELVDVDTIDDVKKSSYSYPIKKADD